MKNTSQKTPPGKPELLVRLVLSAAFFIAGVIKFSEPGSLATVIRAVGLVPGFMVEPLAYAIPLLELLVAAGVLLRIRLADWTMTAMLVGFMVVLGYGMWLGLDIDCGCYGPGDPEATAFSSMSTSLVRDAFMLVGCCYLLLANRLRTNAGHGDEPVLHTT